MKKLIQAGLSLALLAGISCLASCDAENEGPAGNTNTEALIGTWTCNEKSEVFGPSVYEVVISQSPSSSNQIRIEKFYHLNNTFVVVNANGNNLTIPQQTASNFSIFGSGAIINQNRINLDFSADDGGGVIDNVIMGLSR
jgi:hypothetical protein